MQLYGSKIGLLWWPIGKPAPPAMSGSQGKPVHSGEGEGGREESYLPNALLWATEVTGSSETGNNSTLPYSLGHPRHIPKANLAIVLSHMTNC